MDGLFGLWISLGVLAGLGLLALIVSAIQTFKEKFDRNFFLTGTAWGLFLGGVLFIWGFISGLEGSATLVDLLTFQVMGNPAASWLFYWGLIILMIAWITNIRASSFWWGTYQNIIQTAVVLGLSVILVVGAVLLGDKMKKKA